MKKWTLGKLYTKPDMAFSIGMPKKIDVSRTVITAPPFMCGVRAAFVCDVHLRESATDEWLDGLLSLIAGLRPDLLLLGGDYAESNGQQLRWFEAVNSLNQPPLGIYAVLGNNDAECYADADDARAALSANGVRLLVNECERIPVGDGTLAIGGVDEQRHGRPDTYNLFDDCAPEDYRLFLAHYPLWHGGVRANLQLSGHTHGGQFNALGITPYTIGFEKKFVSVIKGEAVRDGLKMLVSRGIGYSRLPLRIGASSEVHLVEFAKD